MTLNDAKKLKIGHKVSWVDGTTGTIRETSYAGIKIEWEDGKWALLPFADDRAPWGNISVVAKVRA